MNNSLLVPLILWLLLIPLICMLPYMSSVKNKLAVSSKQWSVKSFIKNTAHCTLSAAHSNTGNSLVILLLIAGLITGGVLLENRFGKGLPPVPSPTPAPVEYSASVNLSADKDIKTLKSGDSFAVAVGVSTKEAVNLIAAKINYPKELLKVTSVEDLGDESPVSLWVTKDDFPEEGVVNLVGGIPNPGLQTDGQVKSIVNINFQTLENLSGKSFEITLQDVQLYSNTTNQPLNNINIVSITSDHTDPSPNQSSPSPSSSIGNQSMSKGSLSLSPRVLQTGSGCTFDVVLSYDSGGSDFVGIDALLTIDPRVLKPVSIQRTGNPPDSIFAPQLAFKNDTITIAYLTPNTRPYQKKAELGKIRFQVTDQKAEGMTAIKIKHNSGTKNNLSDSNILVSLKDDLLAEVNSTFVVIKPGSCNQEKTYEVIQGR